MTQRIRRVGLDWLSPERVAAHLAGDVCGLRVLDFGCGSGVLLDHLAGARVRVGVDVSQEALSRARARCGRDVFLVRVGIHGALPFGDETFDLAVSTEVLEHVPDERLVLGEIARVLRPGGRLILTTPHKHWLTGLDVGNLKFRFPRLHAFFRMRMGGMSPEAFGRRYGGENGLIGDISVQVEPWHRHYSLDQLRRLTASILEIERYYVFGPLTRILHPAALATERHLGAFSRWLRRRDHRSRRVFNSQGYDICIVARKNGAGVARRFTET